MREAPRLEERETLEDVALDPRQQRHKALLLSLPKEALSVFCNAAVVCLCVRLELDPAVEPRATEPAHHERRGHRQGPRLIRWQRLGAVGWEGLQRQGRLRRHELLRHVARRSEGTQKAWPRAFQSRLLAPGEQHIEREGRPRAQRQKIARNASASYVGHKLREALLQDKICLFLNGRRTPAESQGLVKPLSLIHI